jgi:hypothetical protein
MEKELSDQKPLPPNPAHLPATSSNLLQHATSVATTALKDKKKFPIDLKSDTIDARIYRAFPKEGFVISREIFDSISKDATNKPVTLNSFNSALNALFNRGIINATSIKKVPPAQKKPEWKQYIKTKYAYSRLAPAELRTRFLIGSNDENHG